MEYSNRILYNVVKLDFIKKLFISEDRVTKTTDLRPLSFIRSSLFLSLDLKCQTRLPSLKYGTNAAS